ncbi:MAG: hypothetical protein AB7E70_10555 [Hyphomicrobiaceae bacterium]
MCNLAEIVGDATKFSIGCLIASGRSYCTVALEHLPQLAQCSNELGCVYGDAGIDGVGNPVDIATDAVQFRSDRGGCPCL